MADTLMKFMKHINRPMLVNEAAELGITEECKRLAEEGFLEFRYNNSCTVWMLTPKGQSYLEGRES